MHNTPLSPVEDPSGNVVYINPDHIVRAYAVRGERRLTASAARAARARTHGPFFAPTGSP